MRIDITPRQLDIFLNVAAAGSFTGAARVLGVSQPALSRTVQLLEDQIGAQLFDRNSRHVMLTPAGAALVPLAERMVRQFNDEFGELAQFVAGRRGRLVIAALPSIAAVLLPDALRAFATTSPDVEIVILDGLSGSVADAVLSGHADLGLTVQPAPDHALTYTPLVSDEFGLVCKLEDPLATAEALTWSIFIARPFIAMAKSSSVRTMTDAAFLQAGLSVSPLYECAFLGTTGALVAAGLGITALPRLAMPLTASSGLRWRPLSSPFIQRQIGVVTRAHRTLSPTATKFCDLLHAMVGIERPPSSPLGQLGLQAPIGGLASSAGMVATKL